MKQIRVTKTQQDVAEFFGNISVTVAAIALLIIAAAIGG